MHYFLMNFFYIFFLLITFFPGFSQFSSENDRGMAATFNQTCVNLGNVSVDRKTGK
jgi:hypothetical protein